MGRLWKSRSGTLGFFIVLSLTLLAVFAPWLSPHEPQTVFDDQFLKQPFWQASSPFWLGTDDVGRDLLSRLLYGARVSMGIGFLCVLLSAFFGTLLGVLAGYFSGWVDALVMRLVDVLMSLPSILLAIVVVSMLGPSLKTTIFAISFVALPGFVRLIRAAVMEEKEKEYVAAARSFGASDARLMFVTILPNCVAPLLVQSSLGFSEGILNAAALGFLGLGAQPPTPEWGTMLSDARPFLQQAPWMVTLPGLCILLAVLGFNLLGDGLRDSLDPKLRGR